MYWALLKLIAFLTVFQQKWQQLTWAYQHTWHYETRNIQLTVYIWHTDPSPWRQGHYYIVLFVSQEIQNFWSQQQCPWVNWNLVCFFVTSHQRWTHIHCSRRPFYWLVMAKWTPVMSRVSRLWASSMSRIFIASPSPVRSTADWNCKNSLRILCCFWTVSTKHKQKTKLPLMACFSCFVALYDEVLCPSDILHNVLADDISTQSN